MPPFKPIPEQERALQLFLEGGNLRIDAYAGAGKTTTLRLLAASNSKRGIYLAFNRNIAFEARRSFSPQVACATSHSIAFRDILRTYRYPIAKLTGILTPKLLMELFRTPESITFRSGLNLPRRAYVSVLLEGVKLFLRSEDAQPEPFHVPRLGLLEFISDMQFADFANQAAEHVGAIWASMRRHDSIMPLGHDGYLKLWALSKPTPPCEYILVDEAQDLNPVLLGVLRMVSCPVVYVGDPFQQIYDWRGAINAMEQVSIDHRVLLSQSFRFGPAIAEAATSVIRSIGATEPVRGSSVVCSHLAKVKPDVILSRSNSSVIANVLTTLSRAQRCHVLGGTMSLEHILEDVRRIKSGVAAQSPELLGFSAWKDVISHSLQPEGVHLKTLVGLVRNYGEERMLTALGKCTQEERDADIICSTAHRAKGREWDHVQLDDDFGVAISRSLKGLDSSERRNGRSTFESEARLLYVALSRAKLAVDIPQDVLLKFNLRLTTQEVLS